MGFGINFGFALIYSFVVYYDMQKINALTIFDTTVVNPFPLLFFGDCHVETENDHELISIAGHYW